MFKVVDTESFLKRAQMLYDGKYDYSKTVYKKSSIKIDIICKKHGLFRQTPNSHLAGHGCRKCSTEINNKKLTKTHEEFLQEANSIHGNKFQYLDKYTHGNTPIRIVCPIHKEFFQKPNNHLIGHGCHKCGAGAAGNFLRWNMTDFIISANKIFNNKYIYPLNDNAYINYQTKIKIICPDHGEFMQMPGNHLAGHECGKCAREKVTLLQRHSHEKFVSRANKVHKNKYTYPDKYIQARRKINILCKRHGLFEQLPDSHLRGAGCPHCAFWVSKGEKNQISIWEKDLGRKLQTQKLIKAGNYSYRVDGYDELTKTCYEYLGVYFHGSPEYYKPKDFNKNCGKTFGQLYRDTKKRIKNLRAAGYNVIYCWETIESESRKINACLEIYNL